MARFKVLVFDWDGTLSDSLSRIVDCLQHSSAQVGLPVPTVAAGQDIIGLGLGEALARLFPAADEQQLSDLKQAYTTRYVALDHQPPPFYDTVQSTLGHLRASGQLMAVATGKSRKGLNRALGNHDLQEFFHATRCADETRSKPHPQMLNELVTWFGVEPGDVCMVGDTEFDMEMAVQAGVHRIGVSYGAHSADRLASYGLVACLDRFADILDYI